MYGQTDVNHLFAVAQDHPGVNGHHTYRRPISLIPINFEISKGCECRHTQYRVSNLCEVEIYGGLKTKLKEYHLKKKKLTKSNIILLDLYIYQSPSIEVDDGFKTSYGILS